jgi:serine/threonine protein kinase
MPAFRYKHGDRPLDGYVIERGVGRGGFGEVYYAKSDSGREVALKVIQGYEQIELRGVSQCMNLKSPHLVTIFDVRHSAEDIPFVIMEYVGGPSLRELIDQQPAGLGVQKAAFFLREIGKGLTFLHDCGIVHRDLKPGNIFYENGYVKIGDYGLSKAMSASQHSGQTVTVGTVHYMAPEIGLGRYDRSIDIYAMGAVLFEMITGQVPYLGASAGEILMKHMSSEPNVSGIEEPFASVIKKAMHKDPAQRYQTVQEMVEAVFGAEHVRESVSVFSPGDLSMVAQRVAGRIAVGVGGSSGPPMPPPPRPAPDSWQQAAFADRPNRVSHLATPPPLPIPALPHPSPVPQPVAPAAPPRINDPIPALQRYTLAGGTIFVLALACGAVSPPFDDDNFPIWLFFALLSMAGGLIAMLAARRWILPRIPVREGFIAHIAVSIPVTIVALLASAIPLSAADNRTIELLGRTWTALILPLMILSWNDRTDPSRSERVSLRGAIIAAVFGLAVTAIFGGAWELGIVIPAGLALASNVLFPWSSRSSASPIGGEVPAALLREQREPHSPDAAPQAHAPQARAAIYAAPSPYPRPISDNIRWLWRGGFALFVSLGIMLASASGMSSGWNPTEAAMAGGFGVGLMFLGLISFIQSFRARLTSWWSYLIKPLALYVTAQISLLSAFMLGIGGLTNEEAMIAIFMLIFHGIVFLTLLLVPTKAPELRRRTVLPPASPPPLPAAAPSSSNESEQAPFAAANQPTPQSRTTSSAPAAASSPRAVSDKLRTLSALIGWSIHTVTFILALLIAVDLPGFIAAGLVDQRMADDFTRAFGSSRWPQLARLQGYILVQVGAFVATAFLMLSRRQLGIAHMIRPIFAAICFIAAMIVLDQSLSGSWQALSEGGPVGDQIIKFLEATHAKFSIVSLLFASLGLALLLWPAKTQEFVSQKGVS